MQLTMSREYAVRAMIHLAGLPEGSVVQISEISTAWDIPETFLRKIVAQLAKAGLITSQRGQGGGIQLAMPAEVLTVLDVIEAIEGKIYLNKCLMANDQCPRTTWCQVHTVWAEAQQAIKTILARKSLRQLALESANQHMLQS
jgi:Rrf2 family transcriptional regulator, iron-sulfur cluster assembly transcription factor